LKRLRSIPLFHSNRAVSYTVSAMLITGTTIILVLVASIYAYQILEQQRGLAEFEVAKKSFLAFNDALENVAWKPGASRSTRFTVQYGYLQLIPNVDSNKISINATVNGSPQSLSNDTFPGSTGLIKYWLSTKYVSFDPTYESYILGDSSSVISGSADSYGRAVIRQQTGWVTVTLDYRVRAMRTAVIKVNNVDTNYVDVWVIKLKMLVPHEWSYIHDLDLQAKSLSVRTASHSFSVSNAASSVSVRIGTAQAYQVPITLVVPGQVVFNVVVAEVQINV